MVENKEANPTLQFTNRELQEREKTRAVLTVIDHVGLPRQTSSDVRRLLLTPYEFLKDLPPPSLPENICTRILSIRVAIEEQIAAQGLRGRLARRQFLNMLATGQFSNLFPA